MKLPLKFVEHRHLIKWTVVAVACLLAVCVFLVLTKCPVNSTKKTEPTHTGVEHEDNLQSTLVELSLHEQQNWFFDFARDYRLDYMPQFTIEEGAPKDAGEYLYWCFAINLDNWGEEKGKMTRAYVEETIHNYFGVEAQQHRSHHKQWDYDVDNQLYIAYPDSLKEQAFYLLNSIETLDDQTYTVYATCYRAMNYLYSQEEEDAIRQTLLDGSETDLFPTAELALTFELENISAQPKFKSFAATMLTDGVSW